jgi:hypothetical protein
MYLRSRTTGSDLPNLAGFAAQLLLRASLGRNSLSCSESRRGCVFTAISCENMKFEEDHAS